MQSAFAREIGVSRQRMSDFLHGRKHPNLEQGLRLLRIIRRRVICACSAPIYSEELSTDAPYRSDGGRSFGRRRAENDD
jgi:hypothetical protein